MQSNVIPTFHYPTTVVFVDDNRDFLINFSLQLDPNLACRLFSSPIQAIQFLNNTSQTPVYELCYNDYKEALRNIEKGSDLPKFDKLLITSRLNSVNRFNEASIALIDYDMPGMNGLTLCKQINNHRIKKILFTGVADDKVAVDAFNQGIIDRFILKQDASAIDKVNDILQKTQQSYFDEISQIFKNSVMLNELAPTFLNDAAFQKFFGELCSQHKFIEYYLSMEPNGFLMLDTHGTPYRLLFLTAIDIESHLDMASDQNAPKELIQQLQRHEIIPYFWDSPDGFYDPAIVQWQNYVFPATPLKGSKEYFYALLKEPENIVEFKPHIVSHHAFLESTEFDSRDKVKKA